VKAKEELDGKKIKGRRVVVRWEKQKDKRIEEELEEKAETMRVWVL